MKDVIYISGHRNPDTDSICSALSYAEFKNKTQSIPAVPVRLGNVSQETQYALDYFNVDAPMLIDTMKLKVEDLDIDTISPIAPDASIRKAWTIMSEKNIKTMPVSNGDNKLAGLIAISNITATYMDIWDNTILAKSKTPLANIVETLSGEVLTSVSDNTVFPGKLVVAAMQPESLTSFIEAGDLAISGDREDTLEALINEKASLIVVTGGHKVSDKIIDLARENRVTMISTPHDSFTTSRLIVQSIPVEYVMTKENIISISSDELVDDAKSTMTQSRHSSYPVLNSDNNIVGMIARYHLISTHKKKLIQVDHNERGQAVDGIEEADILEILDHHRIADIQTASPLYLRAEPVGCTSTIVAKRYFENGIKPSKTAAGLMCSAILSDTLIFKSPTCTPEDKTICLRLAEIAEIDAIAYGKDLLKAGTSLKGKSVEEIFNQDFKPFVIQGTKVGVAQVNTMDIEGFMETLKEEMLDYMTEKATQIGADVTMLLLTDIIEEGSQLLVAGKDPAIAEESFGIKLENNTAFLPGVLSRKKQVVPPLTNAITKR
ncbi:putative manganese-dependent inorganic diphosphatase [uncultured Clostridium sp.]|uniref:putative manganese-dependent inorganic diphosphatase n=1 Tax=uncultured Clostridium sp. TaxID=59620 RepID=UPI00261A523C|nr:putative manganese-dependent inorganic diphosphatase [uncultured Clostridium sp.]